MNSLKAYKGFEKDMTCKGFQYEEGKEYHTDNAICCKEGFHACERPLSVLEYYPPNTSVYHEVEMFGDIDEGENKICATDIKIGGRLDITGLVSAAIEFTMKRSKNEKSATGNRGAASATGYQGAASADNKTAIAIAWGKNSKAKGKIGAHLVLSEWGDMDENYNNVLVGAIMVRVDGKEIEEDVYYQLKNGKVEKADE